MERKGFMHAPYTSGAPFLSVWLRGTPRFNMEQGHGIFWRTLLAAMIAQRGILIPQHPKP